MVHEAKSREPQHFTLAAAGGECVNQAYDRETALKETLQTNSTENNAEKLPAPKGIGMSVAFDWGLTKDKVT